MDDFNKATFYADFFCSELEKATFYADLFCSELAAEVYKNAVGEAVIDKVSYLVNFADRLWQEIEQAQNDTENGTDY